MQGCGGRCPHLLHPVGSRLGEAGRAQGRGQVLGIPCRVILDVPPLHAVALGNLATLARENGQATARIMRRVRRWQQRESRGRDCCWHRQPSAEGERHRCFPHLWVRGQPVFAFRAIWRSVGLEAKLGRLQGPLHLQLTPSWQVQEARVLRVQNLLHGVAVMKDNEPKTPVAAQSAKLVWPKLVVHLEPGPLDLHAQVSKHLNQGSLAHAPWNASHKELVDVILWHLFSMLLARHALDARAAPQARRCGAMPRMGMRK
mmetsp:Transcript_63307/g.185062  ORF Transcript_63307/g.185062 Transcript_63307/m.185062 type:complete len:258 (-) Transcript_63307:216-989(-)